MTKNNISLSSSFNYDIAIDKQIELIADAGFNYFSFGSNLEHFDYLNKSIRSQIFSILNDRNITIDTVHGRSIHQDKNLDMLKSTIEAAKELKADTIVLHISPFYFKKEEYDRYSSILMNQLTNFVDLINTEKINVALENVFPYHETELLLNFYSQIKSQYIGFCYDSSHDQIDGPRDSDLLDKMIDKLKAVHLSDRVKPFVDHVIPGEGFIDFDKIVEKFAKSNFRGPYLFEVMMNHSKFKEPKEFLTKLKEEGEKIIKKLVNITQQRI